MAADSPFGGFFIGVGAIAGALIGLSAASQQEGNGCAVFLVGAFFGAIAGGIVEHVLGFLWKTLLVCLTILLMILRFQACAAIREGIKQSDLDNRRPAVVAPISPNRAEAYVLPLYELPNRRSPTGAPA